MRGLKALLASGWCLLVFACAFVIPLLQLLVWFWQRGRHDLDERYVGLVSHTLYLGAMAALLTVSAALLLAFARRQAERRHTRRGRPGQPGLCLARFGVGGVDHAGLQLPGQPAGHPVVRLVGRGRQTVAAGQPVGLLLAYLVRFIAVAYGPLESSLERIRPSLPEASRSLGVGGARLFLKVYLPLLLPGALSAALLVFVDVLKEMPATLLMRPFGWDTLAVRVFEMTSEGEWASVVARPDAGAGGPVAGHRPDPPFGPSTLPRSLRVPARGLAATMRGIRAAGVKQQELTRNVIDRRRFATPGRRNPWDSARFCTTCTGARRQNGRFRWLGHALHYGSQVEEHHQVRSDCGCSMSPHDCDRCRW